MRLRAALFAVFAVLAVLVGAVRAAGAEAPAVQETAVLDLALPEPVMEIGAMLVAREAGAFTLALRNSATQPVTRILKAVDAPGAALAVFLPSGRAKLETVESAEQAVVVDTTPSYGVGAFRITLAGAGAANLTLRFSNLTGKPVLLAWGEDAFIGAEQKSAILASATNALLAASFAFALGAAVLSGAVFAQFAAAFLAALLFAQVSATASFEDFFLAWSGPHALMGLALALAMAGGLYLLDRIAPLQAVVPAVAPWLNHIAAGILAVGFLAYLNVPFAGLLVRVLVVLMALIAPAYLLICGRDGNIRARRLAPAASIFALVVIASACDAIGLFGVNLIAPKAIGGFSAAGALLLAVASAVPIDPLEARIAKRATAHIPEADTEEGPRERAALAASLQGVFDFDLKSGILNLSGEAAFMLGLTPGAAELDTETWLSLLHPSDRKVFSGALDAYRRNRGIPFRIEFRAQGRGGKSAWFELRATMTGGAVEAERCLGLLANITARKKAESGEVNPNTADPLTGLGTRAELLARLDELRKEEELSALAVFDVDRFKTINASLGHEGGDALLVAFAERLSEAFPADGNAGGQVFRVGGDMFAAAIKCDTDLEGFGNRLLQLLNAPFRIGERDIYLPSSVGIGCGKMAKDAREHFWQAERAMLAAKREGGARAVVYSRALSTSETRDAVAIDADMRRALERGEIEIHYQPVVRLIDGAVAGFEALMRWRHPEGFIEPSDFVPLAERTGLIIPLGKFALRRAAEDLARWQNAYRLDPPLFVSVNAAWPQINDKSFAKDLGALLKATGVAVGSLKLELTEGQLKDTPQLQTTLKRLKTLGAGLSIDDFGAGHSSLGRLSSFPFDTVKLDRSFITGSSTPNGAKILRAMILLARDLDMTVICEGIETEAEAELLNRMGCDYGQGFLFGVPASTAGIDAMIAKAPAQG